MPEKTMPETAKIYSEQSSADEFSVHRQLVFWLFVATAILTITTTIVLLGADQGKNGFEKLTILPIVAISGTLGAFVSALRRLYSFQDEGVHNFV